MSDTVNILYQFDDRFAPIAGVSIISLFENNKHIPEIRVYVLDGGISEENRQKLTALAEQYQRSIRFIEAKSIDQALESQGVKKWRNSYAAYYKVYAIEHITEHIDRLLSLDGDTVINGRIDSLYNFDLEGKTLGMVQDIMPAAYLKKIGVGNDRAYFNSGVILFDVRQWKQRRCHQQIEQFFAGDTRDYVFLEQDALNVLFSSEIQKLSIKYNYYAVLSALDELLSLDLQELYQVYSFDDLYQFYSCQELIESNKNAIIYHYTGGTVAGRPWEKETGGRIFLLWERFHSISPWKDMEKWESQESVFHRIEKKLSHVLPSPVFLLVYKLVFQLYWYIKVRNTKS